MNSKKTSFVDSLLVAAKDNPLAAALIGGGALWLLTGNDAIKAAANSAVGASAPVIDAGASALRSSAAIFERSPPTAPEANDTDSAGAGGAGGEAFEVVSEVAGRVKDRFEDGAAIARDQLSRLTDALPGRESFEKAQSSLTDALERQPLLLGAVGLAVGAAVAGAFRSSGLENEWVGQYSDQVKADFSRRTEAVSQSLREASDTLKAELGDLGQEAVDRAKQTTLDAVAAAREASHS